MVGGAFIFSLFAMSNLMPLLLRAFLHGVTFQYGLAIFVYSVGVSFGVLILAKEMYRLDRRAGRIRRRFRWFE